MSNTAGSFLHSLHALRIAVAVLAICGLTTSVAYAQDSDQIYDAYAWLNDLNRDIGTSEVIYEGDTVIHRADALAHIPGNVWFYVTQLYPDGVTKPTNTELGTYHTNGERVYSDQVGIVFPDEGLYKSFFWIDHLSSSDDPLVIEHDVIVQNAAPTIVSATLNGVAGDIVISEGDFYTLQMEATDPGSDTLTFTINHAVIGPSLETTPGSTRISAEFSPSINDEGVYIQTFEVDDGDGGHHELTRDVTVNNVAPTITSATLNGVAGDIVISEGDSYTLQMEATDPGSDLLSFTINDALINTSPVNTPGSTRISAEFSPSINNQGVYIQTFKVDDGDGGIVELTRDVTVNNVAPTIENLTIPDVLPPNILLSGETVDLSVLVTDPGIEDLLTVYFDLDFDGNYETLAGTGLTGSIFTVPFTAPQIEQFTELTIGVQAFDGDDSTYSSFTMIVPEPSSFVLMGLSGLGIVLAAFRRRRAGRST